MPTVQLIKYGEPVETTETIDGEEITTTTREETVIHEETSDDPIVARLYHLQAQLLNRDEDTDAYAAKVQDDAEE